MAQPIPFFREAGNGPGVVCLHANASTSSQWRNLMDCLAPNFRVLAPDLYGSGQSPDWPSREVISLHDEAALIEPVLASAAASRKPAITAAVGNVRRWAHALLNEPTPLAALRTLDMQVLFMLGKRSTVSAHGV